MIPTLPANASPDVAPARFTRPAGGVPDPLVTGARRWFVLAVGSLVVAGLLSLAVVLGRLPILSGLIGDPLFFKRCLVVHVDLALVVWFYAFVSGLLALAAAPGSPPGRAIAFGTATAGVVAMLAGALVPGAQPVLANYVPVIDHPLFLAGLGCFFAGILHHLIAGITRPDPRARGLLPVSTVTGLQASGITVVLAAVTWLAAIAGLPPGLDPWTRHEFSAWGAGHALQAANVAAMLAVWLWLVERATGSAPLPLSAARTLFAILVAPHFILPLLTARGTLDSLYHSGATLLMRWTLFPVVLVVLGACLRHLWRERDAARSFAARTATAGFAASAALTVLGIVLGACIRSSTTLVPAHYHASLGGVTAAFMAAAYLVAELVARSRRGWTAPWASARRQLAVFGAGQAVFALGFAIGGAYGLGRKAYGAEQHVRSAGEVTGLVIMGLGGLVAVVGGLWFLFLIVREMRGWLASRRTLLHPAASLSLP